MRAFIIAIGSELLETDRLDTNSLRLADCLRRHGVELVGKSVAGDSGAEIGHQLAAALETADVVIATGGLGPTADDLTREAVAAVVGRGMTVDEAIVADIREKFDRFGMEMPDVNRRQALVIEDASVLDNAIGTAPGQRLEHGGSTLFLLPGVPAELETMIEQHLDPWLGADSLGSRLATRSLRIACRSESAVEQALAPVYESFGSDEVTVLASAGDIEVRFTVRGDEAAAAERLDSMLAAGRTALGRAVYAEGRDADLERVVGGLLERGGHTVATAESCTGGLIAERLTDVPGSSAYFLGGAVTYSDAAKKTLLGVRSELLRRRGAVSEDVAIEMARGARRLFDADFALASTGIAGPGGGTSDKPVGTVHVAVCGGGSGPGERDEHRLLRLPGDRRRVRRLTSQWTLELLRRRLLGLSVGSSGDDVG